jgi:BirA family biotin operon repressor/biotin-[acetyl-CoA-carboxylase] ligase
MPGFIPLSSDTIRASIADTAAGAFVHRVMYYPQIGSTNDVCREFADAGTPEGMLVIADEQLAGRGRMGRRWVAPAGGALLLSLLFRPPLDAGRASLLTMLCGLAAVEAVEACTGLRPGLKWPNDLLLGDEKFAGMLSELGLTGERLDYVVVGLGLNANFDPHAVEGAGPRATSLQRALGHTVDRLALLAALLERVAVHNAALRSGEPLLDAWRARLVTLGRRVTVSGPSGQCDGLAESTDADGALIVRLDDGAGITVRAGDVTLRPEESL